MNHLSKKRNKDLKNESNKEEKQANTKKEREANLSYFHIVIPIEYKFLFLYTYLKKFSDKKLLILFSTIDQIEFFTAALEYFKISFSDKQVFSLIDINNKIKQERKYEKIIFYENPNKDQLLYYSKFSNEILLILLKNEVSLLDYYQIISLPLTFQKGNLFQIQKKFEDSIEKDFKLYNLANNAYKSYIRWYSNCELNKEKRNCEEFEYTKACFQFGFSVPMFISVK
jgi:ATP-dependent RNA helicase DDX18/HAS1